ncbi:hypothetical protein ACP70R_016134 [Stipagrostis hirtigluma subsp. patula]
MGWLDDHRFGYPFGEEEPTPGALVVAAVPVSMVGSYLTLCHQDFLSPMAWTCSFRHSSIKIVIEPIAWLFEAIRYHTDLTEIQVAPNDERTVRQCNMALAVKDRFGPNPPIYVHASGLFHEDGEVAQRLGVKAAVLSMNAQTPYWFVDISFLKLRALEQGQPVTTYLTNFTDGWANPLVS